MAVGIAPNIGDGPELIEGRWALGLAQGQNFQFQTISAKVGAAQAGATQISATTAMVYISVVTSATDSIKLPAAKKGLMRLVLNGTTNAPNIYGFNATDKIAGTVGTTAYQGLTANKSALFFCPADGFWGVIVSA